MTKNRCLQEGGKKATSRKPLAALTEAFSTSINIQYSIQPSKFFLCMNLLFDLQDHPVEYTSKGVTVHFSLWSQATAEKFQKNPTNLLREV